MKGEAQNENSGVYSRLPEGKKINLGRKTPGPRYGLETVLGILALLGAFFSAFLWIDTRYARDSVVNKIEQRLDLKITNDQLQNIREQIWKHEERLNVLPTDRTARELLRSLRVRERDLEQERDRISKRETK